MRKLLLAAVAALSSAAVWAGYYDQADWICNTNKAQEASGCNSWFRETCSSKLSCWEGGVWAEAGKKYMIRQDRMRAPASVTAEQKAAGGVVFPGDTLAIDGVANLTVLLKDYNVQIDDFRLCQGSVQTWSGGIVNITGGIGVFAGEKKDDQFGIVGRTETMNFYASITSGVERAGIKVYCENPTKDGYWPFNACFLGDCSKFFGTVRIYDKATLYLGCPTMPADFDVTYETDPNTRGAGTLSTRAANGASVTVNSISVDNGAELVVQSTNTLVTTDLTLKSGAKLTFALSDSAAGCETLLRVVNKPTFAARTKVDVTMPTASDVNAGMTYTLFEAPEGAFAEDDFEITVSARTVVAAPVGTVSVKTEDGKTKLVLACRPALIKLMSTDGASYQANLNSSFTNAANWETSVVLQEKAPIQPGYDYAVFAPEGSREGLVLRTPEEPKNTLTFPKFLGDSLTLRGTSSADATLAIRQYALEVPRLVMCNGSYLYFSDKCNVTLTGRIELPEDDASVKIEAYGGLYDWVREIKSEIEGGAPILVTGRGNSGSAAGNLTLSGLNTNFTGRITVTCPVYAAKGFPGHEAGYFEMLKFDDPRNLGSRPTMDWQGIKLQNMSELNPLKTMTLAEASNRGIFISGEGGFCTPDGVTLTVETPITYRGIARKEGGGTLALAGKALFVDGKDATKPTTGSNVLNVVEGAVMPLAANCLDGVKAVFADGTKIVCDVSLADAGMATTGIVNTKEPDGTPFAIAEGASMEKIPVEIVGLSDVMEAAVPLGTFKDAATAEKVAALLDVRAQKGYSAALVTDGAKVVANVVRKGLMLLVK